jgi:hypothetical protein
MNMAEPKVGSFEGYAIVSKFGHSSHVGFVTTEAYGGAMMFRCDSPGLPERDYILEKPEWANEANGNSRVCPVGSKVRRAAVPAESVLIGVAAVYDIRPCTEQTAIQAIERLIRRELILLELPNVEIKALPEPEDRKFNCCGGDPESGHLFDCVNSEENDDEEEEPG